MEPDGDVLVSTAQKNLQGYLMGTRTPFEEPVLTLRYR